MLKRLANRARISRNVSPHVLRHTFAVTAIQKGISLPALQRLLGHDTQYSKPRARKIRDLIELPHAPTNGGGKNGCPEDSSRVTTREGTDRTGDPLLGTPRPWSRKTERPSPEVVEGGRNQKA